MCIYLHTASHVVRQSAYSTITVDIFFPDAHCNIACTRDRQTNVGLGLNKHGTVYDIKNKLDKFWSNQDLMYNYKAELTRIGNRSFINNLDQ